MRHFLFEFITGGGLSGQALSENLIGEGEVMIQTLLNELSELDGSDISLSRDSRLALFENNVKQYVVDENINEKLPGFIKESNVSWLIAPETDDCLEKYAALFVKHGQLYIGSSPEAIKLTASKYITNTTLSDKGIKVVETRRASESLPDSNSGWIVKPDDGVGAEETYLIDDINSLSALLNNENAKRMIVQPYIQGQHMSMSLLVFNGDVQLLACNRQYIEIKDNVIKLKGIGVNECLSFKDEMLVLAKKIVSTISGLAGYVGVDLIEVDGELFVLEVNPRFTTAYAGISESLACNVTSKILNTFLDKKLPVIKLDSAIPVRINI
jgi:tyramine---L-glutamate ligase